MDWLGFVEAQQDRQALIAVQLIELVIDSAVELPIIEIILNFGCSKLLFRIKDKEHGENIGKGIDHKIFVVKDE